MKRFEILILGCIVFGCGSAPTDSLLVEARELDSLKKYQEAIAIYDKVLLLDSINIDALYSRGTNKGFLGDRQGEVDDLRKILKFDSTNTSVLFDLGVIYGNMGKYQEAIASFNYAVQTKGGEFVTFDKVNNPMMPDYAKYDVPIIEIMLERGIVYYKADSIRKAYFDLTYCIENAALLSHEKLRDSYYYRGVTYLKSDKPRLACEDLKWAQLKGMAEATPLLNEFCK